MIESREDLKRYLRQDALACRRTGRIRPFFWDGVVWKFQYMLRIREYEENCIHGILRLVFFPKICFDKLRFRKACIRCNYTVPLNFAEEGLSFAHPGTVVINTNARLGKNCRIQTGVTLGSTGGSDKAPVLGDNVFLGDGCKLIGDISIASDVVIGANAVVTKSIEEAGTTWGGIPARKLSSKDSHGFLSPYLDLSL